MPRSAWHILRDVQVWCFACRLPMRLEQWAATRLLLVHSICLMHQIRQDVWRALQSPRAFAPAVVPTPQGNAWHLGDWGQLP